MAKRNARKDIEQTLGFVPSFFESLPDEVLDEEWTLFKAAEMGDGPIPVKYRELIGVAISGVTKCRYCALFHSEMAKLSGATDEEIEAANRYAKNSAGWSAYINGMQADYDEFRQEVLKVCEHVKSQR